MRLRFDIELPFEFDFMNVKSEQFNFENIIFLALQ